MSRENGHRPLAILMAADVDPVPPTSGAERVLHEYSARLAARGHRIIVICRREDRLKPESEAIGGVQVHRYDVNSNGTLTFLRSAIQGGSDLCRQIVASEHINVINLHQPLAAEGVFRVREARNIPRIYTFHSPWSEEYHIRHPASAGIPAALHHWANVTARRLIERRCLHACERVQVLSDYSYQQLAQIHRVPRSKVSIIPGGVDTVRFAPVEDRIALRRKLGIPPDALLLLTVRNLEPRMGVDALLDAMPTVCQARPEVHLVIGGSGPLTTHLQQRAAALKIDEHVTFAGFIPEADLASYYAAADLFVLPTRGLEGFGLVTVEAMACGTPVLGTPVGGTQEILRGFDESFLFSGTSAEDLAEGILQHLPRIRGNQELRARCRAYVEENYSWDVIIPRIEALFYAAARGNAAPTHARNKAECNQA
jgi:glycosyltransferase involved in cell wall biosynthesis